MRKEQLAQFKDWTAGYISSFYTDEEYFNANIRLKDDHTYRVCDETVYLADLLGLGEKDKLIAETIALFHDIGRFEQFARHRTYNDPRSINHCLLSLDILRQNDLLQDLEQAEKDIIESAIEFHGTKELPGDLDDRTLLFARLIRDADKLDIYYVVINAYEQFEKDPANFILEVEFPDTPDCSPEIVRAVLNGELIHYRHLKTLNDVKLLQLGWVFDVNFPQTLSRIKEKGYLEKLISYLPKTEEIAKVADQVLKYVENRIKRSETGS